MTLSSTTAGATIYYTIDGSAPTTSSTRYSGPITVSSSETINAIATATGSTTSAVLSASYTLPVSTPTASPAEGTFTSAQNVILSTTSTGAKIYYTNDGSTPSLSSTLYTSPIAVSASVTIRAVAALNGQLSSALTAAYNINLPPVSLIAYAGSGQSAEVGNGFTTPLSVRASNALGTPVAGVAVTFSAPASGPGATFSAPSCTTDTTGQCMVTARANTTVGTFTVNASAAGLGAAFTLTDTGLHSYVVTVASDTTGGVSTNCIDQPTNSGGANLNCSLRDALMAAYSNATSTQPVSITFAQSVPTTITLLHGSLSLPAYTTVQGATSGSGTMLTNLITIDGGNALGVFTQNAGVTQTTLNNLTITHGYSSQIGVGGAVYMFGSLAVNNCTFIANQAALSGGAISNNGGTLTVFGSTFQGNSAQSSSGFGGGIDIFGGGTATVSNSTFTGNQAATGGGFYSSGSSAISASTFVGNTATVSGGGIYNKGNDLHAELPASSTAIRVGTALASTAPQPGRMCCSHRSPLCRSTPQVSQLPSATVCTTPSRRPRWPGYTRAPPSLASGFGAYFSENYSGLDTTSISSQSFGNLLVISPVNGATLSTLTITNPGKSFTAVQVNYPNALLTNNNVSGLTASQLNLSPLQNNGGPTQTFLPLTGSPALCTLTPSTATGTDQRGQPRTAPVGSSTCQDAGAVQTSN